ncbi:hypothetical protein BDA99DRAFT_548449 [Phascolomyces articulosus]|uniref:Uncharacterized protein n=1 Tax=Phascolomyces articulosus TaxID=60185 RepID=A0AAD5PA37_9FUNG|nr:hypothetical protein BDA99DRAFT_548449 [Phascolomyces articulosus]
MMDHHELYTSTWNALGAFDYIAANKFATRFLRVYQPFSHLLVKLTNCENLYTQLSFLKPKWYYMRKDPATEDINKEIAVLENQNTLTEEDTTTPLLAILHALVDLCRVRQTFIHLYQALLHSHHKNDTSSFQSVLKDLESLEQKQQRWHEQDHLGLLGLGVVKEIRILHALLKARQAIIDYAFQDACIALFHCKQNLNEWKMACQEQEDEEKSNTTTQQVVHEPTWKTMLFGGFTSSSNILHSSSLEGGGKHLEDAWPNTIRWFGKYLDNLYAKMTLYFHNILLEKEKLITEDDPEKALWKGIKIDYHEQICTFRKRFGAHCVGLLYEVTSVPFYPQGYVLSGTPYEPPQGIHSFPFIYCQPNEPPKEHMPNIISILQGSRNKLSDPKAKPVYFFDSKISSTYYLAQVDDHVVLVVIYFERQIQQREPTTLEFMSTMVTSLRGTSVLADLSRME